MTAPDWQMLRSLADWASSVWSTEWQHLGGVRIDTLANPGWRVRVAISSAASDDSRKILTQDYRSEHDWVVGEVVAGQLIQLRGGPLNLSEVLVLLLDRLGIQCVDPASKPAAQDAGVAWLQAWFEAQCDYPSLDSEGWEEHAGVVLQTTASRQWDLAVDLKAPEPKPTFAPDGSRASLAASEGRWRGTCELAQLTDLLQELRQFLTGSTASG